ncbi:MAG: hypothetical protein GXO75_14345, partial [Calditrichaeota bacterium]|nr:hypothetical protein [Calditrichota bacterium]
MRNRFKSFIVTISLVIASLLALGNTPVLSQPNQNKPLYLDPSQPFEKRIDDLIGRMTLEEKVSQLSGTSPAIERLSIPAYHYGNECVHGVKAGPDATTVFPQAIALASSWDTDLILQVSTAISDEARARFNSGVPNAGLTFWSPVINICRDPRWGRTQEAYGEDPYLTSQIGLAFVRGLQGDDPKYLKTVSSPKHFAANNEEWRRHTGSAQIDEAMLREYYLPAYRTLIEDGKAFSIMAAYNSINGVPCCCNKKLLTDILRDEWGFKGYVVSDCGGVRDIYTAHHYASSREEAVALAINAGMDLNCGDQYEAYLLPAVKDGLVSEATVDRALFRVYSARFRLGDFDPPEMVPYSRIPMSVVDSPQHRELARQACRESIVLLKNDHNVLPLNKNKIKSIAVIGPNADVCQTGDYSGKYSKAVTPLEGLQNKFTKAKIAFEKGCDITVSLPPIPSDELIPSHAKKGQHGLRGEYFASTSIGGKPALIRIDKTIDFDWGLGAPDAKLPADSFAVRWTGKFVPKVSGEYYLGANFDDEIRIFIDGKPFITKWNNRNRNTAVKALTVEAGKSYDLRIEYTEHWYKAKMQLFGAPVNPDQFKDAVRIAKESDAAIIFAGTDTDVEDEGVDRSDLKLPGIQEDLIKAVSKANPNTILVLVNGSALAVNWAKKNVPAILEAWFPGEEEGNAIADVIAGDYNPAGRLPLTFYKSVKQLPAFDDYDIRKGRTYKAEIRKGGSYSCQADQPLFPFGYGLSYTQFQYSNLHIEPGAANSDGKITVQVTVKNIGDRSGDEVVQLYIRDVKASVPRPLKELKGFKRIHLKAGEQKEVSFPVQAKDLSFYDVVMQKFVVEPGQFDVMVGGSSDDVRL